MGQGQRERQGGVRWCGQGVPIPFWVAQCGRRRKWEGQRESSHVEKPANTACHLRRPEETTSVQPAEHQPSVYTVLQTWREREEERLQSVGLASSKGIIYATLAVCHRPTDRNTHSNTGRVHLITHKHTRRSVVCVPVSGS